MSQKEICHLPSAMLEIEFSGDETIQDHLQDLRPSFKNGLLKCLMKNGLAFQQMEESTDARAKGDIIDKMEAVIDAWIIAGQYKSFKSKDKQSRKVKWGLSCEEEIIVFLLPNTI